MKDTPHLIGEDFEAWLADRKNLKDLSEDIGANWYLVKHFLTDNLESHGFFVLSKREIEMLKKECEKVKL